jgi:hypothetical protein
MQSLIHLTCTYTLLFTILSCRLSAIFTIWDRKFSLHLSFSFFLIPFSSMDIVYLFFEQVGVMTWKNLHQKRLAGRSTLKEILTPLGLLGFWIYIMYQASLPLTYPDAVYVTRELPPLSSNGLWGIFRSPDLDNVMQMPDVIDSKRLYYSPNSHDGVNYLV